MLTERELNLMSHAFQSGHMYGYHSTEYPHASFGGWLEYSAADGVTVEMELDKEALPCERVKTIREWMRFTDWQQFIREHPEAENW